MKVLLCFSMLLAFAASHLVHIATATFEADAGNDQPRDQVPGGVSTSAAQITCALPMEGGTAAGVRGSPVYTECPESFDCVPSQENDDVYGVCVPKATARSARRGLKKGKGKNEGKGKSKGDGKGGGKKKDKGKGKGGSEPEPELLLENKLYYSSPYDGRLFSFSYEGSNITFFGPYGKELNISLSVEIISPEGNRTTFTLNEMGNVTKMEIVDFNDVYTRFEFDYLPNGLLVKLLMPAFNYQASVLLPPFSLDNSTEVFTDSLQGLIEQVPRTSRVPGGESGNRHLQSSNPAEAFIFIVECFQNIDPLELTVTASSDGNSFPVSPQRVSEGFYKASLSVVDTEISDDIIGFACDGISLVGSYACPFVIALAPGSGYICAGASTALAATGAGAAVAGPAFSACVAGFSGGAAVCAVYEVAGGGLPPGAPNIIDEACQATSQLAGFIEDLFFPETVTVDVSARLPSGDFVQGSSTWQPESDGSNGPPIELEGPGIPEVTEFVVIPDAPFENQGYTAFAFIICATDDTTASISIQGTDGYTDETTCSGPSIRSSGGCSLNVPGAEAGVVDTLALRVNDPATGEIFRTAGLFFR